jgi:TPR repeat protein
MYELGRGVPVDLRKAGQYYDKGCAGGDKIGCDNQQKLIARLTPSAQQQTP